MTYEKMYYEVNLPHVTILNWKFNTVLTKLQTEYKDYLHQCVIKVKQNCNVIASYKLYRYCLMEDNPLFVEKVKHLKPTRMDCIVIDTNTNNSMKICRLIEMMNCMERSAL